jgi:hypothetical protein
MPPAHPLPDHDHAPLNGFGYVDRLQNIVRTEVDIFLGETSGRDDFREVYQD